MSQWDFTPTFDQPQQSEWAPKPAPAPAAAPASTAAAPAAPVDDVLGRDPAYQAFKRALGLESSTAKTNTQAQVDAINRQTPIQQQWLGFQNDLANKRISGGMEARGIYRSGETNTTLGNQAAVYGHSLSALDADTQNRIAALQQALSQQEAGFGTRDAEQQQVAYQRRADSDAQAQIAQQQASYQEALLEAMRSGGAVPGPNVAADGLGDTPDSAGPANLAAFHLTPAEAYIVNRESGGRTTARNPSSGAFGIGQLNPSSGTLQSIAKELGVDPYTTDPATQVAMMRRYIKDRYGTAEAAQAHSRQTGWY